MAEGATHVAICNDRRKIAFTLAEVLITLGVVGVVAAITMPVLMTNINMRINSERHANIAYKMTQAMEQMRAHGKLVQYSSTSAFVDELQKYLKIQKRCSASNIAECWPTETILDKDGNEFTVSDAKTRKSLLTESTIDDDNVGLILADGASIILTYNKNTGPIDIGDKITAYMKDNPKGQKIAYSTSVTESIDFMTDVNGKKGPNAEGKDVKSFRSAHFAKTGHACDNGPAGCLYFMPTYVPINCDRNDANVTITEEYQKYCSSGCEDTYGFGIDCKKDYWAGAQKACAEAGMRVPSVSELSIIYNQRSYYKSELAPLANFATGWFWSSEERSEDPETRGRGIDYRHEGLINFNFKPSNGYLMCID